MTKPVTMKTPGAHTRVSRSPGQRRASEALVPYWHLLPLWLAAKYRPGKRASRSESHFLDRIVEAQYLLFRVIRIQDDLYDGHTQSASLIFKADQLLFEAEEIVSKLVPRSSKFWNVYWDCMKSTTKSIVAVDMLQQKRGTPAVRLVEGYAKICAVFKISSAAVCARANRWQDFARVSAFCDEMAKAGQIIDDVRDIVEDLERNRYNYVANVLYRTGAKKRSLEETSALVTQNFFQGVGLKRVFLEIRKHVTAAEKAIHVLVLQEATQFLVRYTIEVDKLERSFDVARMKFAFGNLPVNDRPYGKPKRLHTAGKHGF